MSNALSAFWNFITFKERRERQEALRRRANYEFIKAEIVKRHNSGLGGLIVNFPGRKFDSADMSCFRRPMYEIARDNKMNYVIFWRKDLMTEEIGSSSTVVNDGTKV